MPVILIVLLVGVVLYLWWQYRTTTLTRDCRWRQNKARGVWHCAYCGAETASETAPRDCMRPR